MSRDLAILRKWSTERAESDVDVDARPLWAQIRDEVSAYLDDGPQPITGDQPLFPDLPNPSPTPTERDPS